jgi:eukaryotic-like serine/threonine-protein kinase
VSGGGVQVPSVIGDPVATAQSILKGAGFNVQVNPEAGPASATPGTVFQQQPSNGTLPRGSTVTIFVATAAATPTPTASATASATPTASASATPTGP